MKTFIGINTLTQLDQTIYANHMAFFYRLGKNRPDDTFILNTPRRMSIDRMRNLSAKMAMESECDYLMFVDDDVVIPVDLFDRLVAADKDIIAGWTIIRGYPYENMFFRYDGEPGQSNRNLKNVRDIERKSGVIDVDAIGFSAALIRVDLLRKIPPPWFVTGPHNTEDIYFCIKAKQYAPDCTICVDTDVETAHIVGTQFVAPWNAEDLRIYEKAQDPSIGEEEKLKYIEKTGDRGMAYVEMVRGPLVAR